LADPQLFGFGDFPTLAHGVACVWLKPGSATKMLL
jgi:hypothetical protein